MERPTIEEVRAALTPIIGHTFHFPKTSNKGATGFLCEKLTGIPTTSASLDCKDGEVKSFPVKKLKDGSLVAKETVAITMLNKDDLIRSECFSDSRCYKKMNRMLMVPYLREGDKIEFLPPHFVELEKHTELPTITEDYDAIRKGFIESGTLSSSTGKLLQNRTKGPKNSTSRAFYLKKEFVNKHIPMTRRSPKRPDFMEPLK